MSSIDPSVLEVVNELNLRRSHGETIPADVAEVLDELNSRMKTQPITGLPAHPAAGQLPMPPGLTQPLTTEQKRTQRRQDVSEVPSPTGLLPSWHTAAVTGGGMVGGLAGPEGIVPGAFIGEALYQMGQHATGDPNAPQTAMQSAQEFNKTGLGTAVGMAIPEIGSRAVDPQWWRSTFLQTPQTLLTKGLRPSDPNFQQYIEGGLDELKQGAQAMGKRNVNTVAGGRAALRIQGNRINAMVREIVDPQHHMPVPGSYQAAVDAQMGAIPTDISKTARAALVNDIEATNGGKDFTIGQLNKLRQELSATQSAFYGKDPSGQLTMDAGKRAVDIARGDSVRQQFYDALDNHGLGGGQAARQLNGRIGNIIHMDDALFEAQNRSVAERVPFAQKALQAGKKFNAGQPSSYFGLSGEPSVDKQLSTAVRRWNRVPRAVSIGIEKPISTIAGQQTDLMPIGAPNTEPLLAPPEGTSRGIGESIFGVQQRAAQAARRAPPPTISGEQQVLGRFPGPLGETHYGPRGEVLSATDEYEQELRRRALWNAGAPAPPPEGQMGLFGGPPELFPKMEEGLQRPASATPAKPAPKKVWPYSWLPAPTPPPPAAPK